MRAAPRTAAAAILWAAGVATAAAQAPSPTPLPMPSPATSPTPLPVPVGVVPPVVVVPGVPAFPASPAPAPSPTPIPPSVTFGAPGPPVRPDQLPPVAPAPAPTARAARLVTSPAIPGVEPHLLKVGDRVRAWRAAEGPALTGLVVAATASALTVTDTAGERAELVSFEDVIRLEVRRTRPRTRRGALIGAAVGLLAGAFLMTEELWGRDLGRLEWAAGTAAFGAVGGGAGAAVGRRIHTGGWRAVDLPPPLPPESPPLQ